MLTTSKQRQQVAKIAARKEADFEAYQRFTVSQEQLRNKELSIISTETFFDHSEIENEARLLIENHKKKEILLPTQEYFDNARTALFEALTASGHLSRIRLEGTPEEVNAQVMDRLLNGFDGNLVPLDQKRRFMEICEEIKIQRVQRMVCNGELPQDTEVLTLSDYSNLPGFRPDNKKGMVRSTSFEIGESSFARIIEQLSRSNADQPEESISFLEKSSVKVKRQDAAVVDLLGTQTVYSRRDIPGAVVDIQRRLDAFKGKNVMYGEAPTEATIPYENLRQISAFREAKIEPFAKELAEYEELLDKQVMNGDLDHQQSNEHYVNKVRALVRQICVLDPTYTKDAFGEKSVAAYEKAHGLMLAGDSGGAAETVAANSSNEQATYICGIESGSKQMSTAEQTSFAKSLLKQKGTLELRPKHPNDRYYLVTKWGAKDVKIGSCVACDAKGRYVAKCSICPECDFKDTEKPGYVERLIKNKSRPSWFNILFNPDMSGSSSN